MKNITQTNTDHMGRKVARVRDLRGLNQTQLGELLGMTKQAISKMEQTDKINDKRLKEIADALGVTLEGLKTFKDESVLYYSFNFYENCGVSSSIGANNIENLNNYPNEKTMEFFEKIFKAQTEKIEKLLAAKK